jgi:hypothetical protein
VPLAQALAEDGHDVMLATGGALLGRLPVPTVEAYPARSLDDAEAVVKQRHAELADVPPPGEVAVRPRAVRRCGVRRAVGGR